MSTFNKIYKKVANNGNDSDYALVGQVGVDGVPLDEYKYDNDSSSVKPGLIPTINNKLSESFTESKDKYNLFLGAHGWEKLSLATIEKDALFGLCSIATYANIKSADSSLGNWENQEALVMYTPLSKDKSDLLKIISSSDKKKISNLQDGYGIKQDVGCRVLHAYNNSEVSSTKITQTVNVPTFTTVDLLNDNKYGYSFMQKIDNYKAKFLVEGLYMVELRFTVRSVELGGRIDVCPAINGSQQRYASVWRSNEISTSGYCLIHTFFLDVNVGDIMSMVCTAIDDEVTSYCKINDIMITCIDSKKFVTLTNTSLSNRDLL